MYSDCDNNSAVYMNHLSLLLTVGARYVSISSYQSSRDDELSFVRGAVVRVVKKHADGWWFVRYEDRYQYCVG